MLRTKATTKGVNVPGPTVGVMDRRADGLGGVPAATHKRLLLASSRRF